MAQKRFDASPKHLFEAYPQDWLAYLRPHLGTVPSGPAKLIDSGVSTVSAAADKVLRVGGRAPWLLHLELQASHFHRLAQQLLQYNVLLNARHDLPVRSVVLLLRPEADRGSLTGVLRQDWPQGQLYLEFHYTVVRLWQQPVEALLAGGPGLLPLTPLAGVPAEQLPAVIQRMERRVAETVPPDEVANLWTATLVLLGLHYPRDFTLQLLSGVRAMRESVTYQAIVEEGITLGKIQGAREILLEQGRERFGKPDAATRAALEALTDLDRLRALSRCLLQASSWDELLASPEPRKRRRKGPARD